MLARYYHAACDYIQQRPRLKQWLWFVFLWLAGLLAVLLLAGVIKLFIAWAG